VSLRTYLGTREGQPFIGLWPSGRAPHRPCPGACRVCGAWPVRAGRSPAAWGWPSCSRRDGLLPWLHGGTGRAMFLQGNACWRWVDDLGREAVGRRTRCPAATPGRTWRGIAKTPPDLQWAVGAASGPGATCAEGMDAASMSPGDRQGQVRAPVGHDYTIANADSPPRGRGPLAAAPVGLTVGGKDRVPSGTARPQAARTQGPRGMGATAPRHQCTDD
jgi:hypothetical protein